MADREFRPLQTQGRKHVNLNFGVTLASGVPQFVEGDLAGEAAGSYLTLADTDTGVITVTTKDPYLAVVKLTGSRALATPTGNALWDFGLPTQDSTTKKWSFTINTWTNAAGTHSAADMVDGDIVYVDLVLRNSSVLP